MSKPVAGVGDDHDVRVAGAPMARGYQQLEHRAQLPGGDRGGIVGRAESHRVQQSRPRAATGLERGDERVRPARDQLRVALPAPIDMAEQSLVAGRGVRAQPWTDIDRERDPPVRGPGQRQRQRQRQRRQGAVQPLRLDPAL
jgi:hypothetical protein